MPSTTGDFINTILKVKALQQQQQQLDEQQRTDTVTGLNTFMAIARQTANPAQLAALADKFAELGVGSRDQLMQTLQNVTPAPEAIHAAQTQAGINVVAGTPTGKGKGSDTLARQTAEATLTGQNAGQLAASEYNALLFGKAPGTGPLTDAIATALAARQAGSSVSDVIFGNQVLGYSPQEQGKASRIQTGLAVSAPQEVQFANELASRKIDWAKVNEMIRSNRADEALKEMGLAVEQEGFKFRAGAGEHVSQLISSKAALLDNINKTKGTPPPGLVLSYIGALNSINQQLEGSGVPTEGQIPFDPNYLTDPGLWDAFKRKIANTKPIVVTPNPGAPRQKK